MNITSKIWRKLVNIVVIVGIIVLNIFVPQNVLADEKGEIKNAIISVGSLNDEGDIRVTKTVEKTDIEGEYKITFDIQGKSVSTSTEVNLDSYTVFVLDSSLSMKDEKWEKAKEAAINFSEILTSDADNNYIALVTFNSSGYKLRDFSNKAFSSNIFGSLNRYTYYVEGLTKAYEYIDSIDDDNAIFNIVFISDGEPNGASYDNILKEIKDKGINVYALAYDLEKSSKAYEKLKNISTNDTVYEVSTDNISAELTKVATEIIKENAGRKAVLKDTIGSDFQFVSGDVVVNGQEISYDVGNITDSGITFSFIIKINEDIDDGWYPTNKGFSLTYIDANNEERKLKTSDSALVYWVSEKIEYSVNYYNESISNEKLGTITKQEKKGTNITSSDIDVTLFKEDGYTLKSITPDTLTLDKNNNIDVVYTKIKNLSYKVNYYIDDILNNTVVYNNVEYGTLPTFNEPQMDGYSICLVTNNTSPIIDNNTIVDVYYCKNDYQYKIRYYFENELKEEYTLSAKYNDNIKEYKNIQEEGYTLDYVENIPLTISSNENDNIINIYYKLKDIEYTVNYLDSNNNKIVESKIKNGKYFDNITEEAKNIKGYKLNSNDVVNIELNDENNEINFYYDKVKSTITFKYVDTSGLIISEDDTITGYYDTPYSISIKEIDNYEFDDDYDYYEGIIGSEDEVITLVYKKDDVKKVVAPITGISQKKYIYILVISLVGLISLIISKILLNLKK